MQNSWSKVPRKSPRNLAGNKKQGNGQKNLLKASEI